ncbi:MAG: biotin synthase BioB [Duncaniella sp.]|uniref:biotin synthase BioB n=1 Tax=Duncaniella sp. TaxID=2518496 RepID=UPI0023CB401D|nr:biotin synthase BioB [Duncaniella sp.]MDE5989060.1 biotin synthase BioB [Duncaniella sp.]
MKTDFINDIKAKVLAGGSLSAEEAMNLIDLTPEEEDLLTEAAAEVTARFGSRDFDSCSIINARSGRCSEDCKWCAQSAHYKTGTNTYPLVDHDTCMALADYNRSRGIGRFSLVTSGRALGGEALETICGYYRELRRAGGMGLCASMGLLDIEALRKLREAGVERYHCNLEAAPSHFRTLCSTHTIEDKIKTIEAARETGMEICSGGIIGMGETRAQRVEFALALRRVNPVSIPINILVPIPGTPLEKAEPLSGREILLTVAIFRMIHPRAVLRFAGGRASIAKEIQCEALRIGINGSIMGDLLTTIGSQIDEDIEMVRSCGYNFNTPEA